MLPAGPTMALAAAASGLLFLGMVHGQAAAPLLGYLVQLPLLVCGLSLGILPAGFASAGAMLLGLALGGLAAGMVFLIVHVTPALFFVQRALTSRREGDFVVWHPMGRVVAETLGLVGLVVLLGLLWLEQGEGGIEETVRLMALSIAGEPGASELAAQIHAAAIRWAAWIPGIIALSWALMVLVNATLGFLIVRRTGQARRPGEPIATFELPGWCLPVAAAAVMGVVLGRGAAIPVASIAALLAALAYAVQGLAVVHRLAAARAWSSRALYIFYAFLVLFSWPLVLGVIALGLADDVAGLRRRLA